MTSSLEQYVSSPLLSKNADSELPNTKRSRVRQLSKRASYLRKHAYRLIDDLKLGHVAFVHEQQLSVIPITIWRVGDHLYLHCLNKSRLHTHLQAGNEVCVSFAQTTECVLTKSAFNHSTNYRSAVLYCTGQRVTHAEQFDQAFSTVINQIEAGRWEQVRAPNQKERKVTALMQLSIVEGSFKQRDEGPNEQPQDVSLPVWHGTKPICPFHSKNDTTSNHRNRE